VKIDSVIKAKILEQPFFKGKVVSGSMFPVIQVGEEIVVDIKARDLKRFDIIVFVQDERLICHYLWTKNKIVVPLLLQTRNMSGGKDIPITEEDYIGRVVSHRLNLFQKLKIILSK
jgi:signal peptidase I